MKYRIPLFVLLVTILILSCTKEEEDSANIFYKSHGLDGVVELYYDSSSCGSHEKSLSFDMDNNQFYDLTITLEKSCRPCVLPGPNIPFLQMNISGISTCYPTSFFPPTAICTVNFGDTIVAPSPINRGIIHNATACSSWRLGTPGEKYYKLAINRTDGYLYGWVHLDVDSSTYPAIRVTLIEHAVNLDPNQPIIVGQKE